MFFLFSSSDKKSHLLSCCVLSAPSPPPSHAWSVKTRRAPSRHCRDAKVYGQTTTVMHEIEHARAQFLFSAAAALYVHAPIMPVHLRCGVYVHHYCCFVFHGGGRCSVSRVPGNFHLPGGYFNERLTHKWQEPPPCKVCRASNKSLLLRHSTI